MRPLRRNEGERREIRRQLFNCGVLRWHVRVFGMRHGQAVACGFGTPQYRDGLLNHVRMCRRSLKDIQRRWKMYRVLREAARETL